MENFAKTMVYHKVNNFSQWKKVFDSLSDKRQEAGEISSEVGTFLDEPNTVYVINEWKSMEAALAFFNSKDLNIAMQNASVVDKPKFLFLEKK